ncbi:hypothetical protein E2986_12983 [Frieseomelitta varia]|uniref:Uncharacterized protein n=1 Tax=Frieseomelitta varia TaxID=561572 RepID=A0A833VQH4_9HYME|nr:hypothetical protein E2986_12983 [Frieseomelitta varia]
MPRVFPTEKRASLYRKQLRRTTFMWSVVRYLKEMVINYTIPALFGVPMEL